MDQTINLLQMGLDGAMKRQKTIANNISNVDTPGYKRKDVDFLSVLQRQREKNGETRIDSKKPTRPNNLSLARTNKKHISSSLQKNENFQVSKENEGKYRNDKNNVDVDYEMAELAKTNLYYNTLAQRISSKFSKLENVINKGGE